MKIRYNIRSNPSFKSRPKVGTRMVFIDTPQNRKLLEKVNINNPSPEFLRNHFIVSPSQQVFKYKIEPEDTVNCEKWNASGWTLPWRAFKEVK